MGGISDVFIADLPSGVASECAVDTDGFQNEGRGDRVAPRKERI
jgi:hypothetical protein